MEEHLWTAWQVGVQSMRCQLAHKSRCMRVWHKHWVLTRCFNTKGYCGRAQYDEEPGHEAFADDFQQAMTYFTKLSLTGGEARPRQQSHGQRLAEGAQAHAGTERQLWSGTRCLLKGNVPQSGAGMECGQQCA